MKADELTKAQCAVLRNQVGRIAAYLYQLNRRVGEKFPPDDQLKQLVVSAQKSIGELHMELVCRSIDGMGWQQFDEKPPAIVRYSLAPASRGSMSARSDNQPRGR